MYIFFYTYSIYFWSDKNGTKIITRPRRKVSESNRMGYFRIVVMWHNEGRALPCNFLSSKITNIIVVVLDVPSPIWMYYQNEIYWHRVICLPCMLCTIITWCAFRVNFRIVDECYVNVYLFFVTNIHSDYITLPIRQLFEFVLLNHYRKLTLHIRCWANT